MEYSYYVNILQEFNFQLALVTRSVTYAFVLVDMSVVLFSSARKKQMLTLEYSAVKRE